ncbi:MAG: GntR family transcriptional regulator [Bradyrhizobiaceae bacterium PARB1]|jgi:DNA-binding GntR family transcriptional regulator|nr:MAG: GntR family transcriptional regulator [Bradyrhizobiaceae bacterium PARB1]
MPSSAAKLQTVDRVRATAAALEEEIVLGWLMPRERLVEEELATRHDVKRHVIREALAELERVGLVERIPNKGAVVRVLDPAEVTQIYLVREALETLAAEHIPLPVGPQVLADLEAVQAHHTDAVARSDARAAFRANMRFHEVLFGACGNPHLVELVQTMAQKVHGARSMTAASPEHLAKSRDEHLAMIDALRANDRNRLVDLCRRHIGPSRDTYVAAVRRRAATN